MTGLTLGVVTVVVALFTLFKNRVSLAGLWSTEAHNHRSVDLLLFNNWFNSTIWYGPITNLVGNVALFLPLGFLLLILSRRHSLPLTILAGAGISLSIEVLQYVFAVGYSDVDDLLFNTIGTAVGGLCAQRLDKRWQAWLVASFLAGSLGLISIAIATSQ